METNTLRKNTSEEWRILGFNDVISQIIDFRGKTPLKLGMSWGGTIPALSANNVKKGYIDFSAECHMASEELYSIWMNKGDLKKDDIVFTMEAPLGNVALIPDNKKYILSQRVVAFRLASGINSHFIYLFLLSSTFQNKLNLLSTGSTAKGVNQKSLSKITFCIPPVPQQDYIALTLETWDQAIKKLKRKIEIKKEIRMGLSNEYVYKRKGSKVVSIDELFELGRGRVISKQEIEEKQGDYPVYSSQTSDNGIFGKINTFDFEGEYLTWTTDGANAGRVFYRSGKFNCTNVCGTAKLKSGQRVSLYFVTVYLNYVTKRYVSYVGNPKLMNGVFGSIEIMLPDYEEQVQTATILVCADQEIARLENKLALLRDQWSYLLDNLITGAIRTPEKMVTSSI